MNVIRTVDNANVDHILLENFVSNVPQATLYFHIALVTQNVSAIKWGLGLTQTRKDLVLKVYVFFYYLFFLFSIFPFQANAPFLYALQISENQKTRRVFFQRGIEKDRRPDIN